ncbi:MAG: conjugative transposon protein TraN [Sphingobacterium sp.]
MRTKKKTIILICAAILFLAQEVTAQKITEITTRVESIIQPQLIEIGYNQTTNLIFPYAIKSVDRGSSEVLVKKVEGVDNILLVKAGIENFEPTNLSVVTAEGGLYSFMLQFSDKPSQLNFRVSGIRAPSKPTASFTNLNDWESQIESESDWVSTRKKALNGIRDEKHDMALQLIGLYTNGDHFYLQFELENNSNIPYTIGQFRLYIRDKRTSKRTASQEIGIEPRYTFGKVQSVNAQSEQTLVIAVDKFTIPDKKQLIIQVMEKNGGRNLLLKIKNKHLLNVKAVQ